MGDLVLKLGLASAFCLLELFFSSLLYAADLPAGLVSCSPVSQYQGPANANVRLFGGVKFFQSALEESGITLSSLKLPAQIQKLSLGSPACNANLAVSDKVLSAGLAGTKLVLEIERDKQRYRAEIDTTAAREIIEIKGGQSNRDHKPLTNGLSNDLPLETRVERTQISVYSVHNCFDWWDAVGSHRIDLQRRRELKQRPADWAKWKQETYVQLSDLASQAGLKGWGAVHIIIKSDGQVAEAGEFEASEVAEAARDKPGSIRLIHLLGSTKLPAFPKGALLQEVHIVFRPVGQERLDQSSRI